MLLTLPHNQPDADRRLCRLPSPLLSLLLSLPSVLTSPVQRLAQLAAQMAPSADGELHLTTYQATSR